MISANIRHSELSQESEESKKNDSRFVDSSVGYRLPQNDEIKINANEVDLSKVCAEIQTRIAKNRHIIFLLQGDIGAGKTTLVKVFAKYVGIKDSVTSPTFSLLHIYGSLNSSLGAPFALVENFGEQQTSSLVLSPKFSTNTKFPPQILELDSNKSDLHDSTESSLRGRIADSHEAIHKNKIDCHDFATQNLAMTRKGVDCHESALPNLAMTENMESADSMLTIYHYDLYQKGVDYAIDLGLLDLLEQRGIHFVEWGDSQLFDIIKNAFENICIISIHKTKNDRIYEFKESF